MGVKSVVVVGAGVAGVQAARALLKRGLDVLVLEQNDTLGGVWTKNFTGFSLQVPYPFYQFAEYPWPAHIKKDEYPGGATVYEYVLSYAQHFGLLQHIRFRCQLARLQQRKPSGWNVVFLDHASGTFQKVVADYVVIATGIYSLPSLPSYPGSENFTGTQMHAKDFTCKDMARGRRVLVVGAGKTALDCASEVAMSQVARSVVWLFRQAHWPMPRKLGSVPAPNIIFSTFPSLLLPPYYNSSGVERAAHAAAAPLKQALWRRLEQCIRNVFTLEGPLAPMQPLVRDLFYGGQILDATWNTLVQGGSIRPLHGEIERFTNDGVLLTGGGWLEADLVLYCTGYTKSYDYLDGAVKARLGIQKDGLYLYRNILPASVPGLAFVGAEVSTFNNVLSSGLQAEWLARLLSGEVARPPVEEMQADIAAQQVWRRRVMPVQRNRSAVYQLYLAQYHAQLMSDMGLPNPGSGRLGLRRLSLMRPLTALDYARAFAPPSWSPKAALPAGSGSSPWPSGEAGVAAPGRGGLRLWARRLAAVAECDGAAPQEQLQQQARREEECAAAAALQVQPGTGAPWLQPPPMPPQQPQAEQRPPAVVAAASELGREEAQRKRLLAAVARTQSAAPGSGCSMDAQIGSVSDYAATSSSGEPQSPATPALHSGAGSGAGDAPPAAQGVGAPAAGAAAAVTAWVAAPGTSGSLAGVSGRSFLVALRADSLAAACDAGSSAAASTCVSGGSAGGCGAASAAGQLAHPLASGGAAQGPSSGPLSQRLAFALSMGVRESFSSGGSGGGGSSASGGAGAASRVLRLHGQLRVLRRQRGGGSSASGGATSGSDVTMPSLDEGGKLPRAPPALEPRTPRAPVAAAARCSAAAHAPASSRSRSFGSASDARRSTQDDSSRGSLWPAMRPPSLGLGADYASVDDPLAAIRQVVEQLMEQAQEDDEQQHRSSLQLHHAAEAAGAPTHMSRSTAVIMAPAALAAAAEGAAAAAALRRRADGAARRSRQHERDGGGGGSGAGGSVEGWLRKAGGSCSEDDSSSDDAGSGDFANALGGSSASLPVVGRAASATSGASAGGGRCSSGSSLAGAASTCTGTASPGGPLQHLPGGRTWRRRSFRARVLAPAHSACGDPLESSPHCSVPPLSYGLAPAATATLASSASMSSSDVSAPPAGQQLPCAHVQPSDQRPIPRPLPAIPLSRPAPRAAPRPGAAANGNLTPLPAALAPPPLPLPQQHQHQQQLLGPRRPAPPPATVEPLAPPPLQVPAQGGARNLPLSACTFPAGAQQLPHAAPAATAAAAAAAPVPGGCAGSALEALATHTSNAAPAPALLSALPAAAAGTPVCAPACTRVASPFAAFSGAGVSRTPGPSRSAAVATPAPPPFTAPSAGRASASRPAAAPRVAPTHSLPQVGDAVRQQLPLYKRSGAARRHQRPADPVQAMRALKAWAASPAAQAADRLAAHAAPSGGGARAAQAGAAGAAAPPAAPGAQELAPPLQQQAKPKAQQRQQQPAQRQQRLQEQQRLRKGQLVGEVALPFPGSNSSSLGSADCTAVVMQPAVANCMACS